MSMTSESSWNSTDASSSEEQANLVNEDIPLTPEDRNMVVLNDDEIYEIPVGEEINNGAENQVAQTENEHPTDDDQRSRRYHHRHTQQQIRAMEVFYRVCPHPDENQRRELGQQLGLHPSQVKFWFQNKRTQMKTYRAHLENFHLRAENENLSSENIKLKESVSLCSCNKCGRHVIMMSPEKHQLKLENARLRRKIEEIMGMTKDFVGNLGKVSADSSICFSSFNLSPFELGIGAFGGQLDNIPSTDFSRKSRLFRSLTSASELKKPLVMEIAVSALQEVDAMARIAEPLWIPEFDRNTHFLNLQEYFRIFQRSFPPKQPGFRSESSLASAIVMMNPLSITENFMEMNKWLSLFSGIISKAMLLEVLSTGVAAGNHDGSLHLISAEFRALSPAIPSRNCVFARYCKQLNEATWAIADISIDSLFREGPVTRCQRKPSGCIIQAMPNDFSKIIWVEHVEVQDSFVHSLSRSIISSCYAYGAKRWVSVLERQCERVASTTGKKDFPYFEDLNEIVLAHPDGKTCVLKLAERMILSFYGGLTASPSNYLWTTLCGNGVDEVRIMTRKSMADPGCPSGLVISASMSFWIPLLPKVLFNYLRDERTRAEWDILSRRGGVQEMAYIGNGQDKRNCVSILRVNNPYTNQGTMVILQECSSEPTSSLIVYAPVDVFSINKLLCGGDPDTVQLLPSGFTLIPSAPPGYEGRVDEDGITNGTLLSVTFQILGDSASDLELCCGSIATVQDLVRSTIKKIRIALCMIGYNVPV